ncbi:MAG: molybdopterin cofactor-binding domain-containing protein [Hyphomicrobiaceae bacterium]
MSEKAGESQGGKWFGAAVKRKEDAQLLSGGGKFVDDIDLPGMLHAAFVRSPHAHARIRSIDPAAAAAMPGVQAVLVHADLPEPMRTDRLPLYVPNPAIRQVRMQHALARDEVCMVGDPVAVVIADSRYAAEDAAARVDVDYDVLTPVADLRKAVDDTSLTAHVGAADNVVARVPMRYGDADSAFRTAAHVFKDRIFQHRGGPFFIECRGLVVQHDAVTDQLTAFVACQGAHRLKRAFMDMLDLGDSQVRVVAPEVGGGFGPKGAFYCEYGAVAAAAMRLGRAVKWIEDRRENFLMTHQERDQWWDLEIAVDAGAKLLGLRGRLLHDNGAYLPWGLVLPWIAATTVPGPYVLPAYDLELLVAFTNKTSCTPVRGAGRPQAVFAMERMMDLVADRMRLDRAEVRRRNLIQPDQFPYKVGIVFRDGRPVTYDSGDYPACQEGALSAAGWLDFPARQAAALKQGRYIGMGLSNAVEGTGLGPYEGATVRVSTTGRITLSTGATPHGQGHKTAFAQVVADQLGVSVDDVTVVTGDTGAIPLGMGTFASRSAVNAGNSSHLAAIEVATKIKKVASEMMEVAEADLELKDGAVNVRGAPGMRKTFREVANLAIGMYGFSMPAHRDPGLEATVYFKPDQSTYASSTHIAEVEVDIDTGEVRILNFVVNHDCGRVINPLIVKGQVIGGVGHGIGNALLERLVHDDQATPVATSFAEYLMPMATDMPQHLELHHIETPSPLNPLGVKGAGEGGTIAAIAAIVGAVENALSPFGVRISETPITPQRIVELVRAAGQPAS